MEKRLTFKKWNGSEYIEETTEIVREQDATEKAIKEWAWGFLVNNHTPAVEGIDDMGDRSDWIVVVTDCRPMIIDDDYEETEPVTYSLRTEEDNG